jgi:cytochrome c biogenesis protein CcmG/thiol:disulfide interchange protein DsbE
MPSTPAKKPPSYVAPERKNTGVIVVIAVAAVAVLALIAAVVISQVGGDDGAAVPDGTQQTQPVVVEGEALPQYTGGDNDPAIGTVPPMLEGRSFDGSSVVIDPNDGTPKLVVFLAHHCPHCQAEVPRMVEWASQGLVPAGVDVYGVATGTASNRDNYPPSAWLEREGWPFPTLADSDTYQAADAWGLTAYPYFVALDGDGKLVARVTGELTQEQFTALLATIAPQ